MSFENRKPFHVILNLIIILGLRYLAFNLITSAGHAYFLDFLVLLAAVWLGGGWQFFKGWFNQPEEFSWRRLVVWLIQPVFLYLIISILFFLIHRSNVSTPVIGPNGWETFLVGFVGAIFMTLTWEGLFRGYAQPHLISSWGAGAGIVGGAVIFSLLYYQVPYNIAVMVYLIFAGREVEPLITGMLLSYISNVIQFLPLHIYFGYLAYKEKSLMPALVSHGVVNLLIICDWDYGVLQNLIITRLGMSGELLPYIVLGFSLAVFTKLLTPQERLSFKRMVAKKLNSEA